MDQQQIKACIDAMAASDLAEMAFSREGWTLRLVRRAAGAPGPVGPSAPAAAIGAVAIAEILVSSGQEVEAGQPLMRYA